jgi:hypothetical protein
MTIQAEYLIDERGQRKSVVLSIRDYLKLVEHLEDLEDSVDLRKAKESATGFVDFQRLATKLKRKGRLH